MAVNKINPKTIFASEAPSQDTPAVFNNKTVGWGESRKNGGRPTIKQMNALQQETDLKILWLNENAVTPYDTTIDYPNNAVTIKDGTFKIFNGTSWSNFLDKASVGLSNVDNTSDLNKPISTAVKTKLDYIDKNGAALPYDSSLTYEENAVVVKDGILQQLKDGVWVNVSAQEVKKYLIAAGVTESELEADYDFLMRRLAQIAVDKGWDASFVVDGDESQHQINQSTIRTVETIADLMRFPTSTDKLVDVVSYHQGKGLGGGKYQYISILPKSAHNGGTIIDPTLTFPTAWDDQTQLEAWFYPTAQTGYGCWSRIGDDGNNIQVFGALPDGVNRVNLLLEKMTDIELTIYAPKGIYRVENFTRQLRGDANLDQKSMRIYGDLTFGSTDQGYSWTNSTVFQGAGDMFKSVVNVRLDNLLFRNTPNATLGKIFTLGAFAQCEWSNCIFGPSNYHIYNPGFGFDGYNVKPSYRNCRFYGAKVWSRYFEGIAANYREENCYTSTNKRGVYLAAPITASIESCVYEYNEEGAIEIDGYGYTTTHNLNLKDVFFETNGAGVPYSGVKSKPHIVIRSTKGDGAEPRSDAAIINFKQEGCYYTDTSSGDKAESCILVDSKTTNILEIHSWVEASISSQVDMYSGSLTAKINFETQYADTKSTLTKIGKELSAKIIRQGVNDAVDIFNKGAASVTGINCDLAAPQGMTLAAGANYDFMLGLNNSSANGVLYVTLGDVNAQYRITGSIESAIATEIFKSGHTVGVNDLTVAYTGYPKLGFRITNTGKSTRFLNVGYSGMIFY